MPDGPGLMLAHRASIEDLALLEKQGYQFDVKVDGIRCLAAIDHGQVILTSRSGRDITSLYPEIVTALQERFPRARHEIDGEIAVLDEEGRSSWPLTQKRAAQTKRTLAWSVEHLPAKFLAFDVLTAYGKDLRKASYTTRRRELLALIPDDGTGDPLSVVAASSHGRKLWELVCDRQLEGMVAKHPQSIYRPGRSNDWRKIKRTSTVTCLVGGYDPGEGSRASTFGALHLYLVDPQNQLVPVGKAGSGFSERELAQVTALMHEPPLIVEVEYLDVSPDGQLRQPIFQRVRTDATVADCTVDQLTY